MKYTYASIVPLIGGETLGMERVFKKRPDYILSYSAFKANDEQLLNHYNYEVPYHVLDEEKNFKPNTVDVVNSVCPCAGLSSLSPSSSAENKANDWMIQTAQYVLSEVKPKVFWGENAPRLASKMGEPIVNKLREIAEKEGYVLSLYKTKSLLHGLSQVRDRTFYFFWQGAEIPILPFFNRPHEKIENTIRETEYSENDPMNVLTSDKIPSENPWYRYVLEVMEGGISHKEFQTKIKKTINPFDYIENNDVTYKEVGVWMKENGYDKEHKRCHTISDKLEAGGSIMRKTIEVPKEYIGAFVGHLPGSLSHPDEDRYLTIREALNIMKMPTDFNLMGGKKNLNMICQNVPVTTAADMAQCVFDALDKKLDIVHSKFLVQDNRKQTNDYESTSNLNSFLS